MYKAYRSKVDTWFGVILGAVPILLAFIIWKLFHESVHDKWFIALPIFFIGICLPISLLAYTNYTITEKSLLIRCSLFKWEISLKEILTIEPTKNSLSSPALSLDRLRIKYGQGKSIMISPLNKTEFIRDLQAMNVPCP
jgi:Bacterial PH domain